MVASFLRRSRGVGLRPGMEGLALIASFLALALIISSPKPAAGQSGMPKLCNDFAAFPDNTAVTVGSTLCFLCDYPVNTNEVWDGMCFLDGDNTCNCSQSTRELGTELCFFNFHVDCTGNYTCRSSVMEAALCTAGPVQIVGTADVFFNHPANVTAVKGNNVIFNCELTASGNGGGIVWQRSLNGSIVFIDEQTPPGNYVTRSNTLSIDTVQSSNAGMYRCTYEVIKDVYLYSNYGRLDYLGEGVTLSFSFTSYTTTEGSSTQVCITFSGSIPANYSIDFSVQFQNGTALSTLDFQNMPLSRVLVGNPPSNMTCVEVFNVSTVMDDLVEGDEEFALSLSSASFIVDVATAVATVIVEDENNLPLFFVQTSYTVTESAGSVEVCLSQNDTTDVSVAAGVTVEVYLQLTDNTSLNGVAIQLPNETLAFNSSQSQDCGTVTILSDASNQDNRIVQLGATSLIQLSVSNAVTITIVDDGRVQCGDLLCFNGATCLQGFICACTSGYTGNQCDNTIAQSPVLNISAPTTRTLGESYVVKCDLYLGSSSNMGNNIPSFQIEWLGPNGTAIDTNGIDVGQIMTMGRYVSLSLNFSSLSTSQAGVYTCRANILAEPTMILESELSLTLTLPQPDNIFVAKVGNLPVTAGLNFTFICTVSLPDSIDTPVMADVMWLKSGGEETLPTDRVTVSSVAEVTSAVFTSSISFHPLAFGDSGMYTCRMIFTPHLSTYLSSGPPATTTYSISVAVPIIPVTLSPASQFLPRVVPYNTFTLTCEATPPENLSLPSEIQWYNENGGGEINPSNTVDIMFSSTMHVSVLKITQSISGIYRFSCEVLFIYDGEVIVSNSSSVVFVNVTAPASPVAPSAVNVYGTGVDFAIISWNISQVTYTPETYAVEYKQLSSDLDSIKVTYTPINDNFSTSNKQYSLFVGNLLAGANYVFQVVAQNIVGESRSQNASFQTRATDPYMPPNGESSYTYPIGAPISWVFTLTDPALEELEEPSSNFTFVPAFHTPLQNPQISVKFAETGAERIVQFSAVSPSLSGSYVLCSSFYTPLLCGGRIYLTVTVPTLSISTGLLVAQYIDGTVKGGEAPAITCSPSDSRAPVQWSLYPSAYTIDEFNIQFTPTGLNHTVNFSDSYDQLPQYTVTFICDLINVEEPDVEIDRQNATVRFIAKPVALLSNDRELEQNAVINTFPTLSRTNMLVLSLVCFGIEGHGGLQWQTKDVQKFPDILDSQAVRNYDDLTLEFFDDDRRDSLLMVQPIAQDTVGFYTCKSSQSDYKATVYTTFQNPYFTFTNPTEYSIPLGIKVEISARYADVSNGMMNIGRGFNYRLTYLSFVEPTSSGQDSGQGSGMILSVEPSPTESVLNEGVADNLSNNYVYNIYGRENVAGNYNLTFWYIQTQERYTQVTQVFVTVPYVVNYEPEVIVRRNSLVTLNCIPNDLIAPILWSLSTGSDIFLHENPQYFSFDPPMLRHRVSFNANQVQFRFGRNNLLFSCGFMNGDNDKNIFNSTNITVYVQEENIKLEHTSNNIKVFNNTVINSFSSISDNASSLHKRQDSPSALSLDCRASQGDHRPVWFTSNTVIGDENGLVMQKNGDTFSYGMEIISNYVARLSFDIITEDITGTYSCVSAISGKSVEVFITNENPYVKRISPAVLNVIEYDSTELEFKIAVQSNGNNWSGNIVFSFSPSDSQSDGKTNETSFQVVDSNTPQNYIYRIDEINRFQDGLYRAEATLHIFELQVRREETINLTVTRRCPREADGGILWQRTLENTIVSLPCRNAGPVFRAGPLATRRCDAMGEWNSADLSSCTLDETDGPFALVWFTIAADAVSPSMEQEFVMNMKEILDGNGVMYNEVFLQSAYIASVSLTFRVDLNDTNRMDNLTQLASFLNDPGAFSTFGEYTVMEEGRGSLDVTASDTCLCSSATTASSLQLCSGAAISPCTCVDNECTCQSPFVGDGLSCTLDSDNDGYPDQPLVSPSCAADSPPAYCIADVCPEVRNPEQDPIACQPTATTMQFFSGCPYGPDPVWGIIWPNTPIGTTSIQPCPGGVDSVGSATRVCTDSGDWEDPNVLQCQSLDIIRVKMEAVAQLPPADAVIVTVSAELRADATFVSQQLAEATDSEVVSLLPLDLNTTNNIVSQVLNVLESSVGGAEEGTPDEELLDVFNNVLNGTNEIGWQQLQSIDSGSQTLLRNTERYGTYLSATLNSTEKSLLLVRGNIAVRVEMVDTTNTSDIIFPRDSQELVNFTAFSSVAQITIPAEAIAMIAETNSTDGLALPTVHIIFRNIEDFLPTNTSALSAARSASLVLSTQIGKSLYSTPSTVFMDNPITLNFSFTREMEAVNGYACVAWNFSDPVGNGSWVSEGLAVVSNGTSGNLTTVECNSTHLTSFAVLVDVAGGQQGASDEERLALQVISYIGCVISSICLLFTVIFYILMGKKLFTSVHYFIHLNLALSLLLGYVVFMLGIELGTSSPAGCAFVAALLQYLFLSAFCWMMCEGVMLYLMLVVVFSKLARMWWFFLLLGYCPPLFFVVVGLGARHDYYGVKGDDGELSFCWLSSEKGTIFAFVAPMIVIIIINVVFLVFALVSLARSKKMKSKNLSSDDVADNLSQAKILLRATLILLPLLGITWLFGLLTLNRNATVFAWLFTIFNSLQGAGIFFFHVIRNEKVWGKIQPKLSAIKQRTLKSSLRYSLTSSSSEAPGSSSTLKSILYRQKPEVKGQNVYEVSFSENPSTAEYHISSTSVNIKETTFRKNEESNPCNEKPPAENVYLEIIHNPNAQDEPEKA